MLSAPVVYRSWRRNVLLGAYYGFPLLAVCLAIFGLVVAWFEYTLPSLLASVLLSICFLFLLGRVVTASVKAEPDGHVCIRNPLRTYLLKAKDVRGVDFTQLTINEAALRLHLADGRVIVAIPLPVARDSLVNRFLDDIRDMGANVNVEVRTGGKRSARGIY